MDDIFRYAEQDRFAYAYPAVPTPKPAPKPSTAGMKPILPKLGKPANIPSPIPPDTKTMSEPHPEGKARPVVPKALRAGNPETLQQRIPRPPKPRHKLQVPMKEAFDRAWESIMKEMSTVSHPEDKERYQEAIEDLEKVVISGSERLMTRFLEDHVDWKTFDHLVQSLRDQEPAVTSRPGLYAKSQGEDMFATGERAECQSCGRPIMFNGENWSHKVDGSCEFRHMARPGKYEKPRKFSSIPGILLDIDAQKKAK